VVRGPEIQKKSSRLYPSVAVEMAKFSPMPNDWSLFHLQRAVKTAFETRQAKSQVYFDAGTKPPMSTPESWTLTTSRAPN
jgi:hypothetical protein